MVTCDLQTSRPRGCMSQVPAPVAFLRRSLGQIATRSLFETSLNFTTQITIHRCKMKQYIVSHMSTTLLNALMSRKMARSDEMSTPARLFWIVEVRAWICAAHLHRHPHQKVEYYFNLFHIVGPCMGWPCCKDFHSNIVSFWGLSFIRGEGTDPGQLPYLQTPDVFLTRKALKQLYEYLTIHDWSNVQQHFLSSWLALWCWVPISAIQ